MASDKGSNDSLRHGHNGVVRFGVEDQAPTPEAHTALHRKLENRHVAMISIGGVIGTGLFLGTAPSLMHGGPLGLLLVYVFMGTICLATMLSLGEMTTFLPVPGGFITLAERFVDPALAFAIGWNYWYGWTLTLPTELAAAAVIIGFWDSKTSPAVWITVFLIVAIGINVLGVGAYGEAEFWFSSIKVTTIVGLIILGIIVDLGGGPNHDRIGFRYWKNPGPFGDFNGFTGAKGQFLGTCSITTQAMFAYIGTEAVTMAAAEARNPRRNIPKAITKIYIRVLLLYVGGVFVIGLLVPSNNPLLNINSVQNASASPFVIAINAAGIKVLPSIINTAILTSAWFYEGLKAQGIDRKDLPFAPGVQPFAAWWCVCGTGFSLIISAWYVFLAGNWSTIIFVTDYFPIIFFPILYFAARHFRRVRPVKADAMDFKSNVAEFDAMTFDDPKPKNWLEATWMWLPF
ncbi:hypothetical protein OG21DRAFT_1523954 [Imleria badia]|nr:hypothetical protein OG21DRAFT_1523954 [Imleria badia]